MDNEKPTDSNPLERVAMCGSVLSFEVPSVFKGEIPFMTFYVEGKKVGELWGTGGELSFTGDIDASAKIFFEHVIQLNRDYIST